MVVSCVEYHTKFDRCGMDKIDLNATYLNALTSRVLRSARLPIALDNDRVALETALDQVPDVQGIRMARIANTLSLENFWASEALLPELRQQGGISVDDTPLQFEFNPDGKLLSFRG